jgi:hypothetical protein
MGHLLVILQQAVEGILAGPRSLIAGQFLCVARATQGINDRLYAIVYVPGTDYASRDIPSKKQDPQSAMETPFLADQRQKPIPVFFVYGSSDSGPPQ